MSNIQNIISEAYESTTVRIVAGLIALGGAPVYLLSMVSANLSN